MPKKRDPQTGDLMMEGISALVSERTGAITYRSRPTWTDGAGERHYEAARVFKTYAEAEIYHLETMLKVKRGQYHAESTMTVADYWAEWFPRKQRQWQESTSNHNALYWRLHLEPEIGNLQMGKVRRNDLQRLVDRLSTKNIGTERKPRTLAPGSIGVIMAIVTGMFGAALVDGIIQTNPSQKLVLPANPKHRKDVWSALQLRKFIASTRDDHDHPLWAFMVATGCRKGEAIALQVRDVHVDEGSVSIRRRAVRVAGGEMRYLDGTKTSASGRTIPIESWALDLLAPLLDGKPRTGLVFLQADDQPYTDNDLDRQFARAVRASGLPPLTPHGVRHSVATAMIAAGVPESVVQHILGHASIKITVDTYAHVGLGMQRSGTAAMGRLLGYESDRVPDTTSGATSAENGGF